MDSQDSQPTEKKVRRSHAMFNSAQIAELEAMFGKTTYPDFFIREKLAKKIGLDEAKVQVWFSNRRSTERRLRKERPRFTEAPAETPIQLADASMENQTIKRSQSDTNSIEASTEPPKPKKERKPERTYTEAETILLEAEYKIWPNINPKKRDLLAEYMGLKASEIESWFWNRRASAAAEKRKLNLARLTENQIETLEAAYGDGKFYTFDISNQKRTELVDEKYISESQIEDWLEERRIKERKAGGKLNLDNLTNAHKKAFEEEFKASCYYISGRRQTELALETGLYENQIECWFVNRRRKELKWQLATKALLPVFLQSNRNLSAEKRAELSQKTGMSEARIQQLFDNRPTNASKDSKEAQSSEVPDLSGKNLDDSGNLEDVIKGFQECAVQNFESSVSGEPISQNQNIHRLLNFETERVREVEVSKQTDAKITKIHTSLSMEEIREEARRQFREKMRLAQEQANAHNAWVQQQQNQNIQAYQIAEQILNLHKMCQNIQTVNLFDPQPEPRNPGAAFADMGISNLPDRKDKKALEGSDMGHMKLTFVDDPLKPTQSMCTQTSLRTVEIKNLQKLNAHHDPQEATAVVDIGTLPQDFNEQLNIADVTESSNQMLDLDEKMIADMITTGRDSNGMPVEIRTTDGIVIRHEQELRDIFHNENYQLVIQLPANFELNEEINENEQMMTSSTSGKNTIYNSQQIQIAPEMSKVVCANCNVANLFVNNESTRETLCTMCGVYQFIDLTLRSLPDQSQNTEVNIVIPPYAIPQTLLQSFAPDGPDTYENKDEEITEEQEMVFQKVLKRKMTCNTCKTNVKRFKCPNCLTSICKNCITHECANCGEKHTEFMTIVLPEM